MTSSHSGRDQKLDYRTISRASDLAPEAWFIPKIILLAHVAPAQFCFAVNNLGIAKTPFICNRRQWSRFHYPDRFTTIDLSQYHRFLIHFETYFSLLARNIRTILAALHPSYQIKWSVQCQGRRQQMISTKQIHSYKCKALCIQLHSRFLSFSLGA